MRGKESGAVLSRLVIRITPAYAGKRAYFAVEVSSVRDHPRLCGEKPVQVGSSYLEPGSPPPMRGKEPTRHIRAIDTGITPAYAGKRLGAVQRLDP